MRERAEAFVLCEGRQRRRILDVRAADLQEEIAEHAFLFRQLRRRRRQPSEHRRERSEQSNTARLREQLSESAASVGKSRAPVWTRQRADMIVSCERRRSMRILDVRAADLQEEMTEQRFSVPSAPTKTAATQRTSPRAERAIKHSAIARAAQEKRVASARRASGYPATPNPTMTPAATGDTYETWRNGSRR